MYVTRWKSQNITMPLSNASKVLGWNKHPHSMQHIKWIKNLQPPNLRASVMKAVAVEMELEEVFDRAILIATEIEAKQSFISLL